MSGKIARVRNGNSGSVEDIRRLPAVFLAERGELFINNLVIHRPLLGVLSFEDVIFGIVDDICRRACNAGAAQCKSQKENAKTNHFELLRWFLSFRLFILEPQSADEGC